jgi:hypothetical protein
MYQYRVPNGINGLSGVIFARPRELAVALIHFRA